MTRDGTRRHGKAPKGTRIHEKTWKDTPKQKMARKGTRRHGKARGHEAKEIVTFLPVFLCYSETSESADICTQVCLNCGSHARLFFRTA